VTNITYVDKDDEVIGGGSIQDAYDKGIIHRVSRVFIYNSKGELLLQRRAAHLKSNPGKWGESAAGHVDEGEAYLRTAQRETEEELGITGLILKEIKKIYTEEDGPFKRKRFGMLFTATYDGAIDPNPEEVSEVRWISASDLRAEIKEHPEQFTEGFRISLNAL